MRGRSNERENEKKILWEREIGCGRIWESTHKYIFLFRKNAIEYVTLPLNMDFLNTFFIIVLRKKMVFEGKSKYISNSYYK